MTTAITKHEAPRFDMAVLLNAIAEKGVTPENVNALEKLAALHMEMERNRARTDFDIAFSELQAAMKAVKAEKVVPDNSGNARYTFAPFEDLMAQVGPILGSHGFSVSFDTEYQTDPLRIVAHCILSLGGHSRTTKFSARVGSGPPKSNDAQADGAACTYAKRYALCNALNIVIEKDTDARGIGDTISQEEAADLKARAEAVYTDEASMGRFLRFCGADDFESIPRTRYEAACSQLAKATNAKPCPVDGTDDGEWRGAMIEQMGIRWDCDEATADKVLADFLKRAGKMNPERRLAAWQALVTGRMDSHKPTA